MSKTSSKGKKQDQRNDVKNPKVPDKRRKITTILSPYHKLKMIFKRRLNRLQCRKKRDTGIKWAPLNVPLSRRLETVSVFILTLTGIILPMFSYVLLYQLLYSQLWWVGLLYTMYILNDTEVASRGGRRWEFFRKSALCRYACQYSPTKLVKTAELDPTKNYIAPTHPHGQVMFGACNAFLSNGADFDTIFPGIKSHLAMVPGRFRAPFLREVCLASGAVSASEESITYLMNKKFKGNFLSINIGGSEEVMMSKPDVYNVILKNKKGYARVAIKTGASVVPVFCFGETRVFQTCPYPEGTWMRSLQDKIRIFTGIAPVAAKGRGFFQYSFGLLAYRTPVYIVVGEPIHVKQNYEPTKEEIDALHHQYIEKLVDLFETHKHKYEPDPNIKLVLM